MPLLVVLDARQPAPMLACGAVGQGLHVRPNAFGNALGESLARGSSGLTDEQVRAGQQWGTQLGGAGSEGIGFGGNRTYSFMGDGSGQSDPATLPMSDGVTPAQRTMLEAGFGPIRADAAQALVNFRDQLIENTDYRMYLQPTAAGAGRGSVNPSGAAATDNYSHEGRNYPAPVDEQANIGGFFDEGAGSGPVYPGPGSAFGSSKAAKLGRLIANDPVGELLSAAAAPVNWVVSQGEAFLRGSAFSQAVSPEMTFAAALNPRIAAEQQSILSNIDGIKLPRVSYMSDDGLGPFTEGAIDVGLVGSGAFSLFRATGSFSSLSRLPGQTYIAGEGLAIGNAGRTGAADYLSRFSSTELDALRTAGLSDVEIARHVELSGDVHLFRGTSPGWAGSPGAQATAVSATTDPYIATVFALEARGQAGQAVVQFGPRSSIGTFDMGNWMAAQEREVGVLMTSRDFTARAPSSVPVDTARQVLGEMGMPELPYTVASPSARSMLLDAAPKMTPEQVAEFIQRINKTGPR